MNKKHKIFFSLCAVFILAFSIFLGDFQTLFVSAGSVLSNEIVEDNSFDSNDYISRDVVGTGLDVSFIAPDNSLLYSTGSYVPSGSSLQDIENNNLALNSCFTELDSNSDTGFKYWSSVRSQSTFSQPASGVGVNVSSGVRDGGIMLVYDTTLSQQFLNKTITLTFKVSNLVGSVRGWLRNSSWDSFGRVIADSNGIYSITGIITSLGTGNFVLYFDSSVGVDNNTYTLEWVKCEIGSTFTGYYNSTLVYTLLSAYDFSNYYYQYDIDTSSAITSDKYFYPIKFTRQYDTWIKKSWNGLSSFYGNCVWTDGVDYYYSDGSTQYVLDIASNTWSQMSWNGLSSFYGNYVWTDGVNYYYSDGSTQYVLDISTSTWSQKLWNGLSSFFGCHVWTDGTSYYYSYNSNQYVLNSSTSTWSQKTWNGLSSFIGSCIWTDGTKYYYSNFENQYVLNVSTSTWSQKLWNGTGFLNGNYVWTDGVDYYYSYGSSQYILNVSTSTWIDKVWNGVDLLDGINIWNTPFGVFFSSLSVQRVLGSSLIPLDSDYYYQNGYSDGFNVGYNSGYNSGYSIGEENAGNYTFFSLISSVIDAPIKVLIGLFNFDFLGVNLWSFFTGLFTLALIILIIKLALGGK